MNPRLTRYYTYIKPVLSNKLVRNYSFLTFSIITSAIFGFFALHPTIKTIISLQKDISEQRKILEQLTTKSNNLGVGKKNYENLGSQTQSKLTTLLPNYTSLPSLIDNMSKLAKQEQASISGLQFEPLDLQAPPTKLSQDASLDQITFSLSAQGSYPNLLNFLSALLKSDRLVSVDSVNFNKSPDGALLMAISAKALFLKN